MGPLCHPMPSWICVNSIIPCPGVIDKEGADTVGVHLSQTITFRKMIAMTHFFHGIEERVHVFIPLEFKHQRDTQSLWRTAFFSYLHGVWEWVQVTSDHPHSHPHLCCHKSIFLNTQTSVEYCTFNRVFAGHRLTFCSIVK